MIKNKICAEDISCAIQQMVLNKEISCCALIVRKDGQEAFRGKWGYSDVVKQTPVRYNTFYRLASMTKLITAIAVMQLVEKDRLSLDAPIADFLPGFQNQRVYAKYIYPNGEYVPDERFLAGLTHDRLLAIGLSLPTVAAERAVTVRDLLSHSSGMGQGLLGTDFLMKHTFTQDKLADRVKLWEQLPLDFQPGTQTGYSAIVGFDILGRIVEIVSGLDLDQYFKKFIFNPLQIKDICFVPNEDQTGRLAVMYHCEHGNYYTGPSVELIPTLTWLQNTSDARFAGYYAGSAGLLGTVEEYDKITTMLVNEGQLDGVRILKKETVALLHTEAADKHLEPLSVKAPGCAWGLGFIIFQEPEKISSCVTPGTYGWSGHYGTHMFIDPTTKLSATFMMNNYNGLGSMSPIARKLEELIFKAWGQPIAAKKKVGKK